VIIIDYIIIGLEFEMMRKSRKYYGRSASAELGASLRGWRKQANLTLQEAALRLGFECKNAFAYLSLIERGKRPIPEQILINVHKVYDIPADEVIRKAYANQLYFPILETLSRPTAMPKMLEDELQNLQKELVDSEKEELLHFAAFILSCRRLEPQNK
jgi:transcriptional regulator with XRE-family HTH domain